MRIVIFGTGGVGGYFGAKLAHAGEDVTFIARGSHLQAIRAQGLRVETPGGEILIRPAQASDNPADVGAADVVIVAVKTWQVPEVAGALKPVMGPKTLVIPLQNGVEAGSQLADVMGANHVLDGLCATFSQIVGPGRIRNAGGVNVIRFGSRDQRLNSRAKELQQLFERAGVKAEVPADIEVALWEKFLFVVPFGGVGAVTRAPIGLMRALPETRQMLEQAMHEIFLVGRARDIALTDDIVVKTMSFLDTLPSAGTASLQRDIADGKPSELEAWNGAVVRLGKEAGVATPVHAFIYHSLLPQEMRARNQV